jgi:hypothetical protein
MKTIRRRICGALLGLCVLGVIVPVVPADDMADAMAEMRRQDEECRRKAQEEREAADKAYQQAQQEQAARDRAYYEAQQEQAARDKAYYEAQQEQAARAKAEYDAQQARDAQDRAQADRESWDKYWREWQQTQDERAAWYKWNEEERQRWEKQRQEQEWEEWMNRGREDWSAGSNSNSPYSYAVPRPPVILNPFVQHKASEDQEKARQQATQSGQQMIENPFSRSPK